jgi:cytosine/adenosine deaminase-related metal-dependent hydrolase
MKKKVIKNAKIITVNKQQQVYIRGFVVFDSTGILQVDQMEQYNLVEQDYDVYDGSGKILMPGMINLHTHLGMIPFRGLEDDCADRLRKFLLPMEQQWMSEELAYTSSKYALCEMLLSGVTTVMDMYYFEHEVMRAAHEMGIRGFFGETLMDKDACDVSGTEQSLRITEDLLNKWKDHPLVHACVAPHGTTTCSPDVLKQANGLAQLYNAPLTLHIAEMDYEMDYFRQKYQTTPVGFMEQLGLVNERLICAHSIQVSVQDLEILQRGHAAVAHCIGSNTKAAKGIAPVKQMLEHGIAVGLGTDGPASGNTLDILTQLKLFANFHKNHNAQRTAFPAKDIIGLSTIGAAKALRMDKVIGSIEVGKQADLVLLETDSVNMFPVYDPCSAVVYSANSSNVDTVFVAGCCKVLNKKLVDQNLDTIRKDLMRCMAPTDFKVY